MRPSHAASAATTTLTAAFERPLDYAASLVERGVLVVGISSASVPVEVCQAAGAAAVTLRGFDASPPREPAWVEPDVMSPPLRALINTAVAGALSPLIALAFPRGGEDHFKAYLYLREFARQRISPPGPTLLLYDLLHSHWARDYALTATQVFARSLEACTARPIAPATLEAASDDANVARAAARRLQALREREPRVLGGDAFAWLGARLVMTPLEYARLARVAVDALHTSPPLTGARLYVAGAPVDSTALHSLLEARGAVVVGESSEWGSRGIGPDVGSTLSRIAEDYYDWTASPRQPGDREDVWFDEATADVDGVVFWLPPHDAVHGWHYPRLAQRLEARGVPHLVCRYSANELNHFSEETALSTFLSRAGERRARHVR